MRAYHRQSNSFIPRGFISLDNRFYTANSDGPQVALANIEIEFFTGKFSENNQPVYQNDIVEYAVPNEFGSMFIKQGVIRYDIENMCYVITVKNIADSALSTEILKVIGHESI